MISDIFEQGLAIFLCFDIAISKHEKIALKKKTKTKPKPKSPAGDRSGRHYGVAH